MSTQEQNTEPKPENPQAFPCGIPGDEKAGWTSEYVPGMTLLDHFAGLAMQGILACNSDRGINFVSKLSYELANAMLKERSKHV